MLRTATPPLAHKMFFFIGMILLFAVLILVA
jgi:hypothetical protein